MTPSERKIATALGCCSFPLASWDKRFARGMAEQARNRPDLALTARQAAHLLRLCQKYRRQIPTSVLVECLDEMARQAERRADQGKPALPDFRKAPRPPATPRPAPPASSRRVMVVQLPLFK